METVLSRYRSVTVLLIAVVGQLILLAWQVKTNQDVRLIRVWAVTAVTPVADIVEAVRRNTIGFLEDYFILLDVREQNRHLQAENSKLKLENHFYKSELATAERARALAAFQPRLPSKTVAARVTGNATVSTARAVFIDRGSTSGIEKGMAVVTPDGLVGKVIAVYPLASQILLVTDPTFSVGVESNNHVRGTLNCKSSKECTVDYIQNEEKVQPGDTFYTSGEDRVFPKGFPAGTVISARPGQLMKDVRLVLSTPPNAAEEVLVILEGVHQPIPESAPRPSGVTRLLPPPPPDSTGAPHEVRLQTEADKIKERYVELGAEQNHVFGAHGSSVPNFNLPLKSAQPAGAPASNSAAPPANNAAPAANAAAHPLGSATPASGSAANQTQAPNAPNASAGANTKSTAAPAAKSTTKTTGPVLPLGAPRRKPDEGPPQ
jgi:rod shape-determining protein MreC